MFPRFHQRHLLKTHAKRFLHHSLLCGLATIVLLFTAHGADVRPDLTKTPPSPTPTPKANSRVVMAENPQLVQRFQVRDDLIPDFFNRSLLALTQKATVADAWKQFVNSDDVVGIKISTAGGPALSSHRSLVMTIVAGLQAAGVNPSNIIIWDRYDDQMISAGYALKGLDTPWQTLSVQPDVGFDPKKTYFNEVVGQLIWGDLDFVGRAAPPLPPLEQLLKEDSAKSVKDPKKSEQPKQISNRSYYTKLLTKKITKLINVPVMSDHQRLGLNGALVSLAMASVDNQRRFQTPAEHSGLAIVEILNDPVIRNKTVLHIMDGLVAQFAGGPEFMANYTASPGILILSRDPVAIDALALERLEAWRKERSVVPIGDNANHIRQAARAGLGTGSPERMDLILLP
ncbi:MAG: DUF362 domain-containing protein [Blastochloris sp.]|nr:DUF362 domain-containing protein [Blastochloris sp.]